METAHFSPQLWFRRLTTWGCLFFLRFSWVKWCVIKCWISYDSSHSWSQWALPSIQAFRCSWKASVPAGDNPAVPAECALDQIWIPSCSGHDVAPTFRLERLWNSFIFHHISWYFMIFHEIPIDSYRFLIWVCLKIWYCTLNSNGLSSFSPYPIPFPAVCQPISIPHIPQVFPGFPQWKWEPRSSGYGGWFLWFDEFHRSAVIVTSNQLASSHDRVCGVVQQGVAAEKGHNWHKPGEVYMSCDFFSLSSKRQW